MEERKGIMIEIKGRAGSGKTRRALGHYCYEEMVTNKNNVLVMSIEFRVDDIKHILVARHVYEMFKSIVSDRDIKIMKSAPKEFPEYIRECVKSAEADLFESGKYGMLTVDSDEHSLVNLIDFGNMYSNYNTIIIDNLDLVDRHNKDLKEFLKELDSHMRGLDKTCIITSIPPEKYSLTEVNKDTVFDFVELISNSEDLEVKCIETYCKETDSHSSKDYNTIMKCSKWESKDSEDDYILRIRRA